MDEVQRSVEHLFETQTVVEIREARPSLPSPRAMLQTQAMKVALLVFHFSLRTSERRWRPRQLGRLRRRRSSCACLWATPTGMVRWHSLGGGLMPHACIA